MQHVVGADVDGDHVADTLLAHHVDGKVVHHGAVDEHLLAMEHRRQHARDRARRAQPEPQWTAAVRLRLARGEIGGDAKIRQRQIADVARPEFLAQQFCDATPADQGYKRKRVVAQPIEQSATAGGNDVRLRIVNVRVDKARHDKLVAHVLSPSTIHTVNRLFPYAFPEQIRGRAAVEDNVGEAKACPNALRDLITFGLALAEVVLIALVLLLPSGTPGAPSVSDAAALAARGPMQAAPVPDPSNPAARLDTSVDDRLPVELL